MDYPDIVNRPEIKSFGYGKGDDARIVPFDSPFVPSTVGPEPVEGRTGSRLRTGLRFSKDERRLRTELG
jgi:hypothetical protein